ncbi:MAG: lipoyl(octanoyl) transferase LipB [Proteobacteria bacterium]|nr:lipoyl(octanoyl) transferase LipB [Pseudomonadota bacterium]MBU1058922.1 lipoyl(octanoyl) transferase LipB [Pseudomonadota bacterium]
MTSKDKRPDNSGVWLDFSRRDYAEMCRLQEVLRHKRQQGAIPDVVILLEHSPCITIGSSGGYHNLLADKATLEKNGITVHDTSRGGNITYHGPGQLVCYPILSLEGEQRDLHAYARKMEEVMIRTLQAFGIVAGRKSKFPGVWVEDSKIGAMGIAVRKWITMHGISLNVCPDLQHFSFIVPCGITSHGVTSMAEVLGQPTDIRTVREEMRRQFSDIFQISMRSGKLEQLIEEEYLETT